MLRNVAYRVLSTAQMMSVTVDTSVRWTICSCVDILRKNGSSSENHFSSRPLSTSSQARGGEDRRVLIQSMPKRDDGSQGEISQSIDAKKGIEERFPDESTPNMVVDGVRFADLHIVHVSLSKNNTLMVLSDAKGKTQLKRTCGMEGFRNTRKGTNIAAQATGMTLGRKIRERGIKNVRVKLNGLGAGRISSVKGLTIAGINVISISDVTDINYSCWPRSRKARRV